MVLTDYPGPGAVRHVLEKDNLVFCNLIKNVFSIESLCPHHNRPNMLSYPQVVFLCGCRAQKKKKNYYKRVSRRFLNEVFRITQRLIRGHGTINRLR